MRVQTTTIVIIVIESQRVIHISSYVAVLGDSVRVVALEVLVQARSILLEMRVGHGVCVS